MAGAGLRLFGHPLHAMLSHFPVALLTVVPALDLASRFREGLVPPAVSFWTLAAGLAAAVPTVAAGFVDYLALEEGSPAAGAAVWHMGWVFGAATLFGGALFFRPSPSAVVGLAALVLECAGALVLGVAAWWGGELVFRHDVGHVRS